MKRLLLPALLAPSVAMAGMVIVDDGAPAATQTVSVPHGVPTNPTGSSAIATPPVALAALPVPPVNAGIVAVWNATVGSTLRGSIQKWADEAKWTLVWDAPDGVDKVVDYRIVAPLSFQGPVDDAVGDCIKLYEHAKKPLAVEINRQQRLLYVHLKYS
jgi:hypothetical protein